MIIITVSLAKVGSGMIVLSSPKLHKRLNRWAGYINLDLNLPHTVNADESRKGRTNCGSGGRLLQRVQSRERRYIHRRDQLAFLRTSSRGAAARTDAARSAD